MPPQIRTFEAKLIKKKQVSQDAHSFYFERPRDFDFIPGQYVKIVLDILNQDERGVSRFFSISSSPTEHNFITITTRIIKSSFKKTLVNLSSGDHVSIRGPHGSFTLEEEDTRPKIFLTGGIGITPFRSMSVYAHDKKIKTLITLIASFSTVEDLIFHEELNNIKNENFKFVVTVTHTEQTSWNGETGRIDAEMLRKYIAKIKNSVYYIAGPESLVDAMAELVRSLGVSEENIRTENFPGY